MGAAYVQQEAYGRSAAEAYRRAVDAAHYDHGHDPYNGTISTTSGVIEVALPEGLKPEEFSRLVWATVEGAGYPGPPPFWEPVPPPPKRLIDNASPYDRLRYESAVAYRRAEQALRRKFAKLPAAEQRRIIELRPQKWETAYAVRDPRKSAHSGQDHRYWLFCLAAE